MRIREAMIAWDAGESGRLSTRVQVGRHPDRPGGWSDAYEMTDGACWSYWHEPGEAERLLPLVFIKLAVRDYVDPQALHAELLKIDEYRQSMLTEDTPGFEEEPEA